MTKKICCLRCIYFYSSEGEGKNMHPDKKKKKLLLKRLIVLKTFFV